MSKIDISFAQSQQADDKILNFPPHKNRTTIQDSSSYQEAVMENFHSIQLMDAKLEAAEARTEARVARLEAMVENSQKNNEIFIAEFKKEIRESIAEFKEDSKYTRRTIIVTGITAAISIIIGVAAFNAALISNMLNAYDQGQSVKDNIKAEITRQNQPLTTKVEELSIKTDEISSKLDTLIQNNHP